MGSVVVKRFARVAQSVEHTLGKGEVIGSIPIASSEIPEREDDSTLFRAQHAR